MPGTLDGRLRRRLFLVSPSPADDIFGVNAPTMFLGSLARLLATMAAGLPRPIGNSSSSAATRWPGPSSIRCSCTTGSRSGSYAPLPNKLNHRVSKTHAPCLHAVGIEAYRDAGGKVPLPWTRKQALRSLDHFWKQGGVTEIDQDPPGKKKSDTKPARLCGAGMLLLGYAAWGNPRRAVEVVQWIDNNAVPGLTPPFADRQAGHGHAPRVFTRSRGIGLAGL